jgi:uncharacterized protein YecE (DUF72 family)
MPPIVAVTRDDVAYLRAHGRNAHGYVHGRTAAERFDYRYSDDELGELADRARTLAESAERVEVVLANGDDALDSALRLRERL